MLGEIFKNKFTQMVKIEPKLPTMVGEVFKQFSQMVKIEPTSPTVVGKMSKYQYYEMFEIAPMVGDIFEYISTNKCLIVHHGWGNFQISVISNC